MFELFPEGPVNEYPQLVNIAYSFMWAFLLASIIAITHKLTFSGEYYPKNFFQSLILGAVITTMVMMAIGDSLARGLGVFGAMAIIRFRTRIEDPRDVLFLFAALSTGLAIGVYGFTTSFAGTILFCIVAFLLHISPFKSFVQHHRLLFTLDNSKELPLVLMIVQKYCHEHRQISVLLNRENEMRYEYAVALKKNDDTGLLVEELKLIGGIKQIKLAVHESVNIQ
jgi:uncharacterized membrane protein YhiD involved in acid resistance